MKEKFRSTSFRGTGIAREPGTYEYWPEKTWNGPWSWVPGPALGEAVPE